MVVCGGSVQRRQTAAEWWTTFWAGAGWLLMEVLFGEKGYFFERVLIIGITF
jgi:hypothetical protein